MSLLPDIFHKRIVAWVHNLSEGILSLLANDNIFFDVDVSLRL